MRVLADYCRKKGEIPFNLPANTGKEIYHIKTAINRQKVCGNGEFTIKCNKFLEKKFRAKKVMLTKSCTDALEITALLAEIKPGDEIIMPSYTFTSTANSFVMRGAKIVFIDVRKDTMNMDEKLIEPAVTKKTRAIVPVHYGGVACEMDHIVAVAKKHKLLVVEDAAQAVMSKYRGRHLGTIGDFGCYSFHETKNYTCGEGGALVIKDPKYVERAEIIWEKGTNKHNFLKGKVDKYTWVDIGTSSVAAEINAAFLWAQLEKADAINKNRLKTWNLYYKGLRPLQEKGYIGLPHVPEHCEHNGHLFYIKTRSLKERQRLISYLNSRNVTAIFHYIPLHSSPAGKKFGRLYGKDRHTTAESNKLLRLPIFYGLRPRDTVKITELITGFYAKQRC